MNEFVARCPACKSKCPEVLENIMRTPTRLVMVEANKSTRKATTNELSEKIQVWGNAAPPGHLLSSRYAINLVTLEKAKILMKGTLVLTEDREYIPLKIRDENTNSDDEKGIETLSDDSA